MIRIIVLLAASLSVLAMPFQSFAQKPVNQIVITDWGLKLWGMGVKPGTKISIMLKTGAEVKGKLISYSIKLKPCARLAANDKGMRDSGANLEVVSKNGTQIIEYDNIAELKLQR